MLKNSEQRTVILDHWYTTAQIAEVGQAWARAGKNRLFLSPEAISSSGEMLLKPEIVNKTALTQEDVDGLSYMPHKILLIMNRGSNHWTSVAIAISKCQEKINVKISFSDSLGDGTLPPAVRDEMQRIETLFRKKYDSQHTTITQEVYQHAWRQSDMASCGPYALKNGERCLAGKGHEPNLGRALIRREQLDLMTSSTAIKGCSTNNAIDEVLVHWMVECLTNNKDYAIFSSAHIERVCNNFADAKGLTRAMVRQYFIDEYGYSDSIAGLIHYRVAMTRMRELMQRHESIRKLVTPAQFDAQMKLLRHRNTMKSIELIRLAITKVCKDDVFSYGVMAKIIDLLARNHVAEAVEKLTEVITDSPGAEPCLLVIAELLGSREIEKDYSLKLIGLAKAYRAIYEAAGTIKTIETPADAPRWLLKEQINLLNAAIIRNDASLLMRVAYVLQDFCSAITEIVTFGRWEPEFRKIGAIEAKLKTSSKDVPREDYQRELESVQTLFDAKKILMRGARIPNECTTMSV